MPDRTTAVIAATFEAGLLIAGAALWWRTYLGPRARQQKISALLANWNVSLTDFLLLAWLVCVGGFAASFATRPLSSHFHLAADEIIVIGTAAGQIGMLGGMAAFKIFFVRSPAPAPPAPTTNFFAAGVVTFLLAMPLVALTSLPWIVLLKVVGIPAEKQDLIRMFLEAKSPLLLGVMMTLACVGAPITEELIFRAGIFRYTRTRLPRWLALVLPACLFAALHNNIATFAPLVALGILFSLAYERTGRIGTTMVAHALFNLNSLVLILARVDL
jgi:uncharacterized protein